MESEPITLNPNRETTLGECSSVKMDRLQLLWMDTGSGFCCDDGVDAQEQDFNLSILGLSRIRLQIALPPSIACKAIDYHSMCGVHSTFGLRCEPLTKRLTDLVVELTKHSDHGKTHASPKLKRGNIV
jgi:hypothetical protein